MHRIIPVLLCIILLAGCALPRVGIYKDPLTAQEHLDLGLAYEQKGELELAQREYADAARELPVGDLYLGNLLFTQGKLNEAEGFYRKALRRMPDDATVRNNLAWLLLQRRSDLTEAERLASEAVSLANADQRPAFEDTLSRIREALAEK